MWITNPLSCVDGPRFARSFEQRRLAKTEERSCVRPFGAADALAAGLDGMHGRALPSSRRALRAMTARSGPGPVCLPISPSVAAVLLAKGLARQPMAGARSGWLWLSMAPRVGAV